MTKRLLTTILSAFIIAAFILPFLQIDVSFLGAKQSIAGSGFDMAFGSEALAKQAAPLPVGQSMAGLIFALILAAAMLACSLLRSKYAPLIRAVSGLIVVIILLVFAGEIEKHSGLVSLIGSIGPGLGFWLALLCAIAATALGGIEAFQMLRMGAAMPPQPKPNPRPEMAGYPPVAVNAAQTAAAVEAVQCHGCGRQAPTGNYCSFCAAPLPQEPREWQCAGCGVVNEPDGRFCVRCGTAKG